MSLRFQEKDEVDREVEDNKRSGVAFWLIIVIPFAALVCIGALVEWLLGHRSSSHEAVIGLVVLVASLAPCIVGEYLIAPVYKEFRTRTKEIDGKVSAIESSMNESIRLQKELLEKLTAIGNRLDEVQDNNR